MCPPKNDENINAEMVVIVTTNNQIFSVMYFHTKLQATVKTSVIKCLKYMSQCKFLKLHVWSRSNLFCGKYFSCFVGVK